MGGRAQLDGALKDTAADAGRARGGRGPCPASTGGTAPAFTASIGAGVAIWSSNETSAISSVGSIRELKTLTAFLRSEVLVLVPPAGSFMLNERSRTSATELSARETVVAVSVTWKSPSGYSPSRRRRSSPPVDDVRVDVDRARGNRAARRG